MIRIEKDNSKSTKIDIKIINLGVDKLSKTKEEKQAQRIEKRSLDNAQKISNNVLGGYAVRLNQCQTDEEKRNYLIPEARLKQTSVEALLVVVEKYQEKHIEENKLEKRKQHLGITQDKAFEVCQFDNALLALDIDNIPTDKLAEFIKDMKTAKTELVELLHSNEGTASQTQAYAYFLHSPRKNLFTDEEIDNAEFYLVSCNWDNKRTYPYYGVRMTPSENPKNTKEIQYKRPIPIEVIC